MTNVAKTLLATVALTAALASPVLANSQLAASIGIPADVAQTLTQGEIATIGAIINDDENHINSYADFAR
ncbi:hypothetical protein SAMN06273572_11187 [Monaibacterium marinum]|uniref:Uncharacterized protein n=1 Tax=Pontivivens marinum TaxID=1690039 RepID=A0A2C9CW46_9RHOB|nr:hypothetical protein [Monaibacterium marinum]SOH95507.1 hypothetical protein SAMN06273572_11187 [Monaibacterium marinum]